MGYACPVCETPQRDGEHLAHHLAFTAMLHGGEHETWLDEHVSDWTDRGPAGLAADVTPHAADAEYHEVFDDTANRGRPDVDVGGQASGRGGGHHHKHAHDHAHGGSPEYGHDTGAVDATGGAMDESTATDPETAAALREARELTRRMRGDGKAGGGRDTDGTDDSDASSDSDGSDASDAPDGSDDDPTA